MDYIMNCSDTSNLVCHCGVTRINSTVSRRQTNTRTGTHTRQTQRHTLSVRWIGKSRTFLTLTFILFLLEISLCEARIRHSDLSRSDRDLSRSGNDVSRSGDVRDGSSDTQSHDVVTSARCRVRCLAELQKTVVSGSLLDLDTDDPISLMNCLSNQQCTACLKPCSQPVLSTSHCHTVCDTPGEEKVCQESCRFLHNIRSVHPGQCPGTELAYPGGPPGPWECSRFCGTDSDCIETSLKCCQRPCGKTCVPALSLQSNDLPPVPGTPTLREKLRGGSIELRWNSVSNVSTALLYIVDSRWNIGQRHSEGDMTPWQQVAQTSGTSAVVNDFTPGHWYQFRVSSVNIHGASHPSVPTHAFKLSKEPQRPSPPTNLTEGDTLIMGHKRAVTLHWFPPAKSDLPVTRYKLFWSKKSNKGGTPPREYRQILSGDKLVYQIPNLESDTTYFVEVQAICHYGEARLKSDKAGIYITTYPVPHLYDAYGMMPDTDGLEDDDVEGWNVEPSAVTDVQVDTPFYQDGVLKANVSWTVLPDGDGRSPEKIVIRWSPEACIADNSISDDLSKILSSSTQNTWFTVHGLRPDCRYQIRVEPVSERGGVGEGVDVPLTTPSCGQSPIIGNIKPDCLSTVPSVPDEPVDVEHSFIISSSNMTSRISWSSPASHLSITGYRVVWGRLLNPHHLNPTMDKVSAITKVLSKDIRTLNIGDLIEGTTYLVRVQALSRQGAGKIATIQFTTPLLQLKPVDPPYMDMDPSRDLRRSDSLRRKPEVLPPYMETVTSHAENRHVIRDSSTLSWQPAKWSAVSAGSRSCVLKDRYCFINCFIAVLILCKYSDSFNYIHRLLLL